MALFSAVFQYLSIIFNLCSMLILYKSTVNESNIKKRFLVFKLILVFVFATLIIISNYVCNDFEKILVSLISVLFLFLMFFKDSIFSLLFKFFLFYVIMAFFDFLVSAVFLFFHFPSNIQEAMVLKTFCTIFDSLVLILVSLSNLIYDIKKLLKNVLKKWRIIFIILAFFSFLSFMLITYIAAIKFNFTVFLVSAFILSFFILLFVVLVALYFKNRTVQAEQRVLLSLMEEYEKILDQDRINKHEILNNLVTLKSYDHKDSLEYERIIDDLILEYQLKKTGIYSKIYRLPAGIKGVIYYKLANIKDKDVDFQIFVENGIDKTFDKFTGKFYYNICKIIEILIDNAIEAALETEEKYILIDIYSENSYIVVYLENTYVGEIDIENIDKKGVSSKGINRGYGLYIVGKIVNSDDNLIFENKVVNNKFVSILKIKNL